MKATDSDNIKHRQLHIEDYLQENKLETKGNVVVPSILAVPSKEEIDSFVDRCCNSEHPNNLFDLDKDTVQVFIDELIITS